MTTVLQLVITWVLMIPLASCQHDSSAHLVFSYASGGAHHPEGFGEWRVQLDKQGDLFVQHDVHGKVTNYDQVSIAESVNEKLWKLIRSVPFRELADTGTPRVPGASESRFVLREKDRTLEFRVPAQQLEEHEALSLLVGELERLIEKYTGESPVLR